MTTDPGLSRRITALQNKAEDQAVKINKLNAQIETLICVVKLQGGKLADIKIQLARRYNK